MRKYSENPVIVTILCVLIMLAAFLLFYTKLPPQVPLFFSLQQGDSQIGDLWMLVLFPILAGLFLGLHSVLSRTIFKDYPFLTHILTYISIAISVIFGLICVKIIFLVT